MWGDEAWGESVWAGDPVVSSTPGGLVGGKVVGGDFPERTTGETGRVAGYASEGDYALGGIGRRGSPP